MTALSRTPNNENYLSLIGWNMILQRAPHIEFFVQEATIPGINLATVDAGTPFVNQPLHGDHIDYGTLDVQIRMDEDLKGYMELYDWITGLGFPKNFEQHKALTDAEKNPLDPNTRYSDISLSMLTNLKNTNIQFNFREAWPTSLSGWDMSNTIEDVMYADCTVSFKYSYFDIESLRDL